MRAAARAPSQRRLCSSCISGALCRDQNPQPALFQDAPHADRRNAAPLHSDMTDSGWIWSLFVVYELSGRFLGQRASGTLPFARFFLRVRLLGHFLHGGGFFGVMSCGGFPRDLMLLSLPAVQPADVSAPFLSAGCAGWHDTGVTEGAYSVRGNCRQARAVRNCLRKERRARGFRQSWRTVSKPGKLRTGIVRSNVAFCT